VNFPFKATEMAIVLQLAIFALAASAQAADHPKDTSGLQDDPHAVNVIDQLARIIDQLPPAKQDAAIQRLQGQLKSDKLETRRSAALTLAKLGDKSGVPTMIADLATATGNDRNNVVVALRILKDERAIPALRKGLEDKDPQIRGVAVAALGELKAKEAYDQIVALTADKPLAPGANGKLQCIRIPPAALACYALGVLGDKRAVPVLIGLLSDADLKGQARQALETLTGQKLGDDPAAWHKWWATQDE
jgi:hypothetical protein